MKKAELKRKAQNEILHTAMQAILVTAENNSDGMNEAEMAELKTEMDNQLKRIEKMFGYEPGSWQRA
jgi:hypothetical protein